MRILLINWARIVNGAQVGGGVNGYCQGLAIELARRGHRISYLSSGVSYTRPLDTTQPPTIACLDDFKSEDAAANAIRVFDIINSPVVAPAIFQFNHPHLEAASPPLEAAFAAFLAEHAFDVVHFHNIEGLSAGCIDVALAAPSRPRVLFSLHNYHTICPQVYLMQAMPDSPLRAPCRDFRNGHACVQCERTHDPAVEVVRRIPHLDPTPDQTPEPSPDHSPAQPHHAPRVPQTTPIDLTLDNAILPEPTSDLPPNDYAKRRSAMVAALSRCHATLAVSSFVRRKFEAMGVDPDALREMPIGTRMLDLARQFHDTHNPVPPPRFANADTRPTRPIRLAFLGYHNFYKGLHVLVEALESLEAAIANRFELHVYAKDVAPIEPRLRALASKLAMVHIEPGYAYPRVPAILADKDLLVVPSVWWDNGPQTVMEAIACNVPVLASAIGGIPDLVTDNVNALLFRAADVPALAARLAEIACEPTILNHLRDHLRDRLLSNPPPLASMDQHAIELESLYAELLAARAASPEPPTACPTA